MRSAATPLRRTRTAAIAAVTVALAAGAHVLGGGTLPDPSALLILAALVIVPVAFLTVRRLSTPTMIAALGVGQVLLHEAFLQLSPAHSMGMAMHDHGMAAGSSPVMLAAHCLATVGTAVVLAKNEAALLALVAWLRPLVRLPEVQHSPVIPPVRPAPVTRHVPVLWRQLKIHPLRGPPLLRTIQL